MLDWILFSSIVFVGLFIQSFIGFGSALFAIPLLALIFEPRVTVPAFQLIVICVNIYLVIETYKHVLWKQLVLLIAGGLIGIPIGAYGLKSLPHHVMGLIIACITIVFGFLFLLQVQIRIGNHAANRIGIGFLSGLFGGSIGQPGPPIVIYGLSRRWGKDAFRATLITFFLFLSSISVISYITLGMFTRDNLLTAAVGVPSGFLASYVGILLKNKTKDTTYRYGVLIVIIAIKIIKIIQNIIHLSA